MPVRRSVMQKTLARATDGATIMVGAHATKGGRAAIVRIATSDLWEIFVRRSVMQRPLARAKDGATRMGGANVAIRSRVHHATSARQVALASNVKTSAMKNTHAVGMVAAMGMEHVDVMRDGRESIVTSVPQGLMGSIARLSAAASTRAKVTAGVCLTESAQPYARRGGLVSAVILARHFGQGPTVISTQTSSTMTRTLCVAGNGVLKKEWWIFAYMETVAQRDAAEDV
jgi:hypothetical protein